MQPNATPIIFSVYLRDELFTPPYVLTQLCSKTARKLLHKSKLTAFLACPDPPCVLPEIDLSRGQTTPVGSTTAGGEDSRR